LKIRTTGFAGYPHNQIQRRKRGIFVECPPKNPQAPWERHIPMMSLLNGAFRKLISRTTKISRLRRWRI
jgi:hypothetical protein